ncbi:glycoside hydrolase family 3 N-terminal domain-containing protein [Bradyrhizobium nanningense]|uniref:glycoside hydrolase family 3 N-terminal domain-containing protein n=1 Tax=Bradyrhizobium nanningense TaxID=1325118 RepID=UPI001FDFA95E|nr:glycoside hydrolase family 3 N-terminal domain-containing protein [Bradyrhizobium nanningense]
MTRFSYAARWAGTAEQVGEAMGSELASLGFNLNFAPVLDIHSNPANPVIGERAFGRTAEDVVKSMLPFTKAMERQGVRACGKHFPGHGDTQVDSHHEFPVVDLDLDQLKSRELLPFAAAIDGGIEMIMTSHILFRQLDSRNPVTLSRPITTGLLSEAMKFGGVIVSDDVGMRAMTGRLDTPDAGARFMAAGNDMLMICAHWTDTERARGLARSIVDGVDSGGLDAAVIAASGKRVRGRPGCGRRPSHLLRRPHSRVLFRRARMKIGADASWMARPKRTNPHPGLDQCPPCCLIPLAHKSNASLCVAM